MIQPLFLPQILVEWVGVVFKIFAKKNFKKMQKIVSNSSLFILLAILSLFSTWNMVLAEGTDHTCKGCKNYRSFLPQSSGSDFSIHNIPFGVFKLKDHPEAKARCGTRIGNYVIDLAFMEKHHLLFIDGVEEPIFNQPSLNKFMSLGRATWKIVR